MRQVWKILLKIAFDIIATIAFFYLAMLVVPSAVGFPAAGMVRLLSFVPGLVPSTWIGDHQSFLTDALLGTLSIIYLMLFFAIGIEILRRLFGSRSIWLYIAGALVTMAPYIGPAPTTPGPAGAFALASPLALAAACGAGYWLVTIRLRAAVIQMAGRLICGPDARSCAFS